MDKQIEEMVKDLSNIQTYAYMEIYPCRQKQPNKIVAEHLVRKGWIKPDENAVVLMGTEKEERFIDLLVEFDEMGFEPTTLPPQDMSVEEYTAFYKNKLLHTFATGIKNSRKETAEKFAEKVSQAIVDNTYPYFDKNGKPVNIWRAIVGYDKIDEICKEIVEGKK